MTNSNGMTGRRHEMPGSTVTFEAARLAFADPRAIDRLDLDETSEDRMLLTGLAKTCCLRCASRNAGDASASSLPERQRDVSKMTTTAKPRETRKGKSDKYGMTAADWARLRGDDRCRGSGRRALRPRRPAIGRPTAGKRRPGPTRIARQAHPLALAHVADRIRQGLSHPSRHAAGLGTTPQRAGPSGAGLSRGDRQKPQSRHRSITPSAVIGDFAACGKPTARRAASHWHGATILL